LLQLNKTTARCPRSRTELYKRQNELILRTTRLYERFTGILRVFLLYRSFWLLFLLCLLPPTTLLLCLYASLYPLYCLNDRVHQQHTILSLHSSYINLDFIIKAIVANIYLYLFPSYFTHILQPFDVSVFQLYKH